MKWVKQINDDSGKTILKFDNENLKDDAVFLLNDEEQSKNDQQIETNKVDVKCEKTVIECRKWRCLIKKLLIGTLLSFQKNN